jgi:cation diffusion facilitator family transporter
MRDTSSRTAVIAGLIGNLLVAVIKFVAAAISGSSAMLTEAVHSVVDTGNEVLLLYGQWRAAKPPDEAHPLGYGRELYFWSFVVAVLIFALGAGVSIYEGIDHIQHPHPIETPLVNYIVLALAFAFEAGSGWFAFRGFVQAKGDNGWWETIRRSKDPASITVLFESVADLLGIVIAAVGGWASLAFNEPIYDGFASVLIGLVLAGIAALLARESKGLLIGERADPAVVAALRRAAAAEAPGVRRTTGVLTVQLAPDQVIAVMSLEFDDALRIPEVERLIDRLERRIRREQPQIMTIFVRPEPDSSATASLGRGGEFEGLPKD